MSSSPDRSPNLPDPLPDTPDSSEQSTSDLTQSFPQNAEPALDSAATASEAVPLVPKRPLMRPVSRPQPSPDIPKAATPSSTVSKAPARSTTVVTPSEPISPPSNPDVDYAALRQQPIPPPSEPKQYRAIGLLRGRYTPSSEQFTRGEMAAADGTVIETVLLGRIMSLVKNHLDLEQEHLWVVYPRTKDAKRDLHVQIVGVWEPEKLNRDETAPESDPVVEQPDAVDPATLSPGYEDDYFSIRGEVVFIAPEEETVVVKIQQTPRKTSDKAKAFKLQLKGVLASDKAVGYFWDLQVKRQETDLLITAGTVIGLVPPKKRSKDDKGGARKPFKKRMDGRGGGGPPSRGTKPMAAPPPRREALPKPSKRSDQSAQS